MDESGPGMSGLDEIRARAAGKAIERCIESHPYDSYDMGDLPNAARDADADRARLLAAIDAIDFALSRYEASGIFMRPAEDIRHVLTEALGAGDE